MNNKKTPGPGIEPGYPEGNELACVLISRLAQYHCAIRAQNKLQRMAYKSLELTKCKSVRRAYILESFKGDWFRQGYYWL